MFFGFLIFRFLFSVSVSLHNFFLVMVHACSALASQSQWSAPLDFQLPTHPTHLICTVPSPVGGRRPAYSHAHLLVLVLETRRHLLMKKKRLWNVLIRFASLFIRLRYILCELSLCPLSWRRNFMHVLVPHNLGRE